MVVLGSGKMWRLVLLTMVFALLTGVLGAQAVAEADKTYIEFIFDASFSMNEEVEKGKSRMDVAKEVMIDLIQNLEDRPGLEVGLRVYGSKNTNCDDSALVQDFGPVDAVRGNILKVVRSLKPKGKTPIAYSLEQAAQDFPSRDSRNIIVLITDGQESCGGDPCAVSYYLQAQGIVYKPHVVGFAMSASEEARVSCIGTYYSAKDRKSLSEALGSIMRKVVAPSQLEIEAWAGGQNVTSQTVFRVTDASGDLVGTEQRPKGDTLRKELVEGIYDVNGTLQMGALALEASQSGIKLGEGESKRVRLDFGELMGRVTVVAQAGGKDVSGQVDIEVAESGKSTKAKWSGVPPTASLQAGTYQFTVTLPLENGRSLARRVQGRVVPGETTRLEVDLGELMANLEVEVTYRKANVTSDTRLEITRRGAKEASFGTGSQVFRHEGVGGEVDLRVTYVGDINVDKKVTGVTLTQGKTTRVTVELDDILGTLRIKVMAGNRDVTSAADVMAEDGQHKLSLGLRGDYRVTTIPANLYGVRAVYQQNRSDLAEVTVKAGQVTDVTLEVDVPGKIILVPMMGDKPVALRKVDAWFYRISGQETAFDVRNDQLVANVAAGVYDIRGVYKGVPEQALELRDIEIKSGETKEVKLVFQPVGKLRIKLTADGKPYNRANPRLMIHFGGEDFDSDAYLADLDKVEKGIYELELQEGSYDLRIIHLGEGFSDKTLYDFKVKGGATTEETIEVGDSGKLRINLTSGGKPHREGRIMVYSAGTDFSEYVADLEEVERGVYELKLKEGSYDLEIINLGEGFPDKYLRGIEVSGGSTTEKTIELGGSGKLRINLTSGGKPHREGRIMVYSVGTDFSEYVADLEEVERGVYEQKLKEGSYDLEIINLGEGFPDKYLRGIEVSGGSTTEQTIELGGIGKLQVRLEGEYDWLRLMLFWADDEEYVCDLEDVGGNRWVAELREGEYILEITTGFDSQWIRGLVVEPSRTLERTVILDFEEEEEW